MRCRILASVLAAALIVAVTGCSAFSGEGAKKETPAQVVSLSDLPVPARATIQRLTSGGQIKKIEKAEEHGAVVYDVEATVQGKDVEYDVSRGWQGAYVRGECGIRLAACSGQGRCGAAFRLCGWAEGVQRDRGRQDLLRGGGQEGRQAQSR